MPNPTSKLNLVINGATTQLDIHDSNAVDLTSNQTVGGNKEFTGTTTAHDVIPSATDTYNFGSSTAQWNNAYIKSLTINGVAAGDILTHNVSEFVNVSTAQTIGGPKTWTAQQKYSGNNTRGVLSIYNSSYIKGAAVSATELSIGTIFLGDGGNTGLGNSLGFISCDLSDTGNRSVLSLSAIKNEVSSGVRANLIIEYDKSDTTSPEKIRCKGNVQPNITDTYNLGTSTNKWKSFNGINPGALSLPSISSSGANAWIALDTTDWAKNAAASAAQKYTPLADGWLNVRVDNATMLGLATTGATNYMHQMVRSETPNSLALLLPVFKNIEVAILVAGNENLAYNKATFYPCQGNV